MTIRPELLEIREELDRVLDDKDLDPRLRMQKGVELHQRTTKVARDDLDPEEKEHFKITVDLLLYDIFEIPPEVMKEG